MKAHTNPNALTEHSHVLQRLQTPATPQRFISMALCVAGQIKGWFSAKRVQYSEATPKKHKTCNKNVIDNSQIYQDLTVHAQEKAEA